MSGVSSEDVAEDFQYSLSDLQINNRYEISNLTIIAKENTEHAQAISKALENHIRTTAPPRKLPALYVLDSIVKNVGTPYTVYLGRNLYSTFMDAYTLVDGQTRKSMEGMLKTWKEPVPGSMDPRPVFPPDVTRVIENALIKARTAVLQSQQARGQRLVYGMPPRPGSAVDYRNTPTPPQNASRYGAPQQQQYQNGYASQQSAPHQYSSQPGSQAPTDLAALLGSLNRQDPAQDLARLHEDIRSLITLSQQSFATNPFDQSIQSRLKALLDLQNILKTQQLSPEAINLIKTQVAQLSAGAAAMPSLQSHPTPQWQPPTPVNQPYQAPPQPYVRSPSVQPAQPAAPPIIAPNLLEALLKSTANGQKVNTPIMHAALPALQNFQQTLSPRPAAATPVPGAAPIGNSLLDALRSAGLVPSQSAANPHPPTQPQSSGPASASAILASLSSLPQFASALSTPPPPPPPPSLLSTNAAAAAARPPAPYIPLTPASLKQPRPELVAALYSAQPNQCSTCAQRFPATDAGRGSKAAHLDWHFRANQRLASAAGMGQSRAWYGDEMEWIRLRDAVDVTVLSALDDDAGGGGGGGGGGAGSAAATARALGGAAKREVAWIPAPAGAAAGGAACPICQERFEAVWHEEAQEWVWMDAVRVGGRVFHGSCHDEVKKAGLQVGGLGGDRVRRSATPEGVLGKRKAEDPLAGLKAKLRA